MFDDIYFKNYLKNIVYYWFNNIKPINIYKYLIETWIRIVQWVKFALFNFIYQALTRNFSSFTLKLLRDI